jgi:uncharacterized protein YndB with AHSA1/START domain
VIGNNLYLLSEGETEMINVEDSIIIHRPIEEVFACVADQTNAPRWQHDLLEVRRITDGPIGVGTKHTAARKFLGRRLELTNEYVRYVPSREITFRGDSGSMSFECSYLTEPVEEGTRLTCRMQMEQGGLFSLAEPLIAGSLKKDFAVNFRDLKALLENQVVEIPS